MTSAKKLFILTLFWLLATPWLLFPGVAPLVSAAAALLLLLSRFLLRPRGHPIVVPTALNGFLSLYLAFHAVAFVVTPLPGASLPKLTTVIAGAFAYLLVLDWMEARDNVTALTFFLALTAVAVALLALVTVDWPYHEQIVDLRPVYALFDTIRLTHGVHRNEVAGILLLLLPFVVASARRARQPRLRVATVSGLFLVILVLLLAQSRAAFLGLMVTALAAVLWGRCRLGVTIFSLSVLLLAVIIATAIGGDALSARLVLLDAQTKGGAALSWLTRLDMWRVALAMIRDYPLFGAGLYTFQPVSRINYIFYDVGAEIQFVHAHNLFLQAGVSFGLPGLLALLGLWGTVLGGLWTADRERLPLAPREARLFGSAVAGFLAFSLLDVISLAQRPGVLVWIVLGGVAVLLRQQRPSWRPPPWLLALPLLLALLLSATPALPRNSARVRLDRAQLQGEVPSPALADGLAGDVRRLALLATLFGEDQTALRYWRDDAGAIAYLRQRGFLAQREGDAVAAIGWYDMALLLDPTLAQLFYWRGQARETLGYFEAALGDYATAVHLLAEQGVDDALAARMLTYYGRALLRDGDVEQAVVVLQQAVARDPSQADTYRQLGDALLAAGDEQAAAAAYERAGAP